jgi:hypothetical protein
MARALNGVDADPTGAEHDHDVAGRDLGGVDRRPPAGRDSAAEGRGERRRHIARDLDAADLRDDGVLREGRQEAGLRDVLVAEVHAEGAVELRALEHQCAVVAQRLHPARTPAAMAAARDERGDDVVALAQRGDPRTDCFDDAGGLVPAAERQVADADVALGEVIVGVAQAGREDAHEHLAIARGIQVDGVHLPPARLLAQDRGSSLHDHLLLA